MKDPLRDIHGKEITIGCRIVFKLHGQERTGIVEYDAEYNSKMKCGGLSLPYIFEHCDWMEVV